MRTLLVTALTGMFVAASSAALSQGTTPAATPRSGTTAVSGAEQTQTEKSREAMDAAAKSKAGGTRVTPSVRGPEAQKNLQDLNRNSTDPAQAKAAVDASKKMARQKPKSYKNLTPEERAALRKQPPEPSKP